MCMQVGVVARVPLQDARDTLRQQRIVIGLDAIEEVQKVEATVDRDRDRDRNGCVESERWRRDASAMHQAASVMISRTAMAIWRYGDYDAPSQQISTSSLALLR